MTWMLPTPQVIAWNVAIALALSALWIMWAFLMWDQARKWSVERANKGKVNCPLCRQMHRPGECSRDQAEDAEDG